MKISRNWLERYANLADKSDSAIEEALTLIGFEVEGIERTGVKDPENIVVGEVESRERHPNADRLSVSRVNVGDGTSRHIVCGAANYKVGDRVFVALPGARVQGPDGEAFKVKKSKLRGEPSEGMMCSARELGLGDDHAGLLILEGRPEIGVPLAEVFKDNKDTIFDIEVTPNRPDCLSHLGVARELAAFFDLSLCYPEVMASRDGPQGTHPVVEEIRVDSQEECPLYYGFSIRDVTVGPSPDWLRRALESVGLRPVNNVVDVTNYVLMETGQPLHAFDAGNIRGKQLMIRQARSGESIVTLDERKRELARYMTVIADTERPLVIAGIMGSLDAEVDDSTRDILLEAAYFRSRFIRRTSRHLGLSTDSSYRFERGIDPQNVEYAALRAIDLILEVAGGRVSGPAFEVGTPPLESREISLDPEFVRKCLGFGPDNRTIESVLGSLELDVRIESKDPDGEKWGVGIPSWRRDLERPIDLVEEFLRIYGTDKIPDVAVLTRVSRYETDPVSEFNRKASALMVGRQFHECILYSLRGEAETIAWRGHTEAETLALANPMSTDQTHLRSSLIPGLLDSLKLNISRNTGMERLFEKGRIFREVNGKVYELISLAFLIYDDPNKQVWKPREEEDFYSCKGILESIIDLLGLNPSNYGYERVEETENWEKAHSGQLGDLLKDGFEAKLGLLSPVRTKEWDLDGFVHGASLAVTPDLLDRRDAEIIHFEPLSFFPPAVKDLALVVDDEVPAGNVLAGLKKAAVDSAADEGFFLESISIFDVYRGEGLPEGKKSLAFSMIFRSSTRTLNDKEVNRAFERIRETVTEGTGYAIRS